MGFSDMFLGGGQDDPYGSMLDEQARRQALKQGISGFGDAILSQGYSRTPRTPFQGIGAGLEGFSKSRDDALQQALRMKLLNRQIGREDVKDTRDTERFGMEKDQFGLTKDKAGREAKQFDATFAEGERGRTAQAGLSKALADAAKRGVTNPSNDPAVMEALSMFKPEAAFSALEKDTKPDYMTVGEGGSVFDKKSGKFVTSPGGGGGGPFRGTGMEAQAANILLVGDPASPAYAAAYGHMSTPRFDFATGQMIKPDMSAYRPPVGRAQQLQSGPTVQEIPGYTPKMTDSQATSALYADRMAKSNDVLSKFEMEGTKVGQRFLEKFTPEMIRSYALTPEYQQFEQAKRDFVNATLRRESGAVINPDEFKNAERQYFPTPGDSKEVIDQKRRNRETALAGIARAGGPAYKPLAGGNQPQRLRFDAQGNPVQ